MSKRRGRVYYEKDLKIYTRIKDEVHRLLMNNIYIFRTVKRTIRASWLQSVSGK